MAPRVRVREHADPVPPLARGPGRYHQRRPWRTAAARVPISICTGGGLAPTGVIAKRSDEVFFQFATSHGKPSPKSVFFRIGANRRTSALVSQPGHSSSPRLRWSPGESVLPLPPFGCPLSPLPSTRAQAACKVSLTRIGGSRLENTFFQLDRRLEWAPCVRRVRAFGMGALRHLRTFPQKWGVASPRHQILFVG